MARTVGARSLDYESKKHALATRVLRAVLESRGELSLHDLARESGASIPTLKHYFGSRAGALAAAMRSVEADSSEHLSSVARPGRLGLTSSLRKVALDLAEAWTQFGVGRLFGAGMALGLGDQEIAIGYLNGVLEPTIRAVEERLRVHATRGEIAIDAEDEVDLRAGALAFISPVLMALLHQHGLAGTTCRPLDVADFVDRHVARYVKGYR